MSIYDCFSYWDEDLLLDLRLNILDKHVDYFVIVEGNKTWQNNPKKLKFKLDNFQKFKDKIIYIPVKDMPEGDNPYKRENHQRNAISQGLKNAGDEDIIIVSDLDEIPNPKKLKLFEKNIFEISLFKLKSITFFKISIRLFEPGSPAAPIKTLSKKVISAQVIAPES